MYIIPNCMTPHGKKKCSGTVPYRFWSLLVKPSSDPFWGSFSAAPMPDFAMKVSFYVRRDPHSCTHFIPDFCIFVWEFCIISSKIIALLPFFTSIPAVSHIFVKDPTYAFCIVSSGDARFANVSSKFEISRILKLMNVYEGLNYLNVMLRSLQNTMEFKEIISSTSVENFLEHGWKEDCLTSFIVQWFRASIHIVEGSLWPDSPFLFEEGAHCRYNGLKCFVATNLWPMGCWFWGVGGRIIAWRIFVRVFKFWNRRFWRANAMKRLNAETSKMR